MSDFTQWINSVTKLIEAIKTCSPPQLAVVALAVAALPLVVWALSL